MNPTQVNRMYQLVLALMETDGANGAARFGDYKLRVKKSFSTLEVVMTRLYKHPDGRIHRTSKVERWDTGPGVANLLFPWLVKWTNELEKLP